MASLVAEQEEADEAEAEAAAEQAELEWHADYSPLEYPRDSGFHPIRMHLQEALLNFRDVVHQRWSFGKGSHHRLPIHEAMLQAELYHQLRRLEEQRQGVEKVSVETALHALEGGRADLTFYSSAGCLAGSRLVHLELKSCMPITKNRTPAAAPATASVEKDLLRLALLPHLTFFVLMGEAQLVDTVVRRCAMLRTDSQDGWCFWKPPQRILFNSSMEDMPEAELAPEDWVDCVGTQRLFDDTHEGFRVLMWHVISWNGDGQMAN